MKQKIKLLALILIVVFLSGFGIKACQNQAANEKMRPITLTYWGVWDDPSAMSDIFAAYKNLHPFVTINYKKFRYSEYEQELLEAWAEDKGPDIFSIHNTWLKKYQNQIKPLPPSTTMVYPIVKGKLKKEIIPEIRTSQSLSSKDLKNKFIDVVYRDVVIKKDNVDQIFGLPLFVDTLAMYYNNSLFDSADIIDPPAYWDREFQQNIKKLTRQNTRGDIVQSGVALGGSANIERYSDILSILMMQSGSIMMNDSGGITFQQVPPAYENLSFNPSLEALRFYTDFANPLKEVYSWDKSLDNSLNLFIQGKLAIFFGYAYHLPQIKARAPKLNFTIVNLPQIEGSKTINFANYWVETVAKKGKNQNTAWDFIQFATRAENVKSYLKKNQRPTALRSLIEEQKEDDNIEVFAGQLLTAQSWYRGADAPTMEKIMGEMIDNIIADEAKNYQNAINIAASKIQQTITK